MYATIMIQYVSQNIVVGITVISAASGNVSEISRGEEEREGDGDNECN